MTFFIGVEETDAKSGETYVKATLSWRPRIRDIHDDFKNTDKDSSGLSVEEVAHEFIELVNLHGLKNVKEVLFDLALSGWLWILNKDYTEPINKGEVETPNVLLNDVAKISGFGISYAGGARGFSNGKLPGKLIIEHDKTDQEFLHINTINSNVFPPVDGHFAFVLAKDSKSVKVFKRMTKNNDFAFVRIYS